MIWKATCHPPRRRFNCPSKEYYQTKWVWSWPKDKSQNIFYFGTLANSFHGWRNYGSFKFSHYGMYFTGSPTIRFPYPLTIAIILLHLPSFTIENKAASQSVQSTSVFEAFLRPIVNFSHVPSFWKGLRKDHMLHFLLNRYFEDTLMFICIRRCDGFNTAIPLIHRD